MADSDILWEVQEIKKHIERMDKRDRLRTIGGFFRGIMQLIPVVVLLYSIWYFYEHGDEIIANVAEIAATKATELTKGQFESLGSGENTDELINKVMKMFQKEGTQ